LQVEGPKHFTFLEMDFHIVILVALCGTTGSGVKNTEHYLALNRDFRNPLSNLSYRRQKKGHHNPTLWWPEGDAL